MPCYFFDLHNGLDTFDREGKELPGLEAAKAIALCEAREMIQASIAENGQLNLCHRIDVRDDTDTIVYVLRFEDAVMVRRGEKIVTEGSA